MKKEFISLKEYATIDAVKQDVFSYVEIFYNRKHLHSALEHFESSVIQTEKLQKTA